MSNIEPLILTRKEAAALLGIGPDTFRKLLAEGAVPPGFMIGRRMRWTRDALIAHLRNRAIEAASHHAA